MIWLWISNGVLFVLVIMLMAAVGHLKHLNDQLYKALIGSTKLTDQNFVFIAERLAIVATIVSAALKNEELAENIDLHKVSTDKLPN
jgi:hypothetical protein